MKLYAIADLHLAFSSNREALTALPAYPDDWLIIAGDVGEETEHLHFALSTLSRKFAQLLWVPGNHDLWSNPAQPEMLRGVEKYQAQVAICRDYGVLTPEDPYVHWPGNDMYILAPLFLLYDYSFRPDHIPLDEAVQWASDSGVLFRDEMMLDPSPYPSRVAWCQARCQLTEQRLQEAQTPGTSFIMINHFPLQAYPSSLTRIPRMSLWSGTSITENWHRRFATHVVVYGHIHMRCTYYRDKVRFEEVSLGYPPHWKREKGIEGYLREILPGPQGELPEDRDAVWRF